MSEEDIKRPMYEHEKGAGYVAESSDKEMCELLGHSHSGAVYFTSPQVRALEKLYGFDLSSCESNFELQGSFRNLMRFVEMDGLRVMAFLAKHGLLEKGEDPVRSLAWAIEQDRYRGTPDIWNEEEED